MACRAAPWAGGTVSSCTYFDIYDVLRRNIEPLLLQSLKEVHKAREFFVMIGKAQPLRLHGDEVTK